MRNPTRDDPRCQPFIEKQEAKMATERKENARRRRMVRKQQEEERSARERAMQAHLAITPAQWREKLSTMRPGSPEYRQTFSNMKQASLRQEHRK